MKSTKEIRKDVEETRKNIVSLDKTIDELCNERKMNEDLIIEKSQSLYDEKLREKILYHNYRIALFNEVMPTILEVLKKWENKPYGEKTKEKIKDEIKEKTNCFFYISQKYVSWDEYVIWDDFTQYGIHNHLDIQTFEKDENNNFKRLLVDNKIVIPKLENLGFYKSHMYIEDVEHHIEMMKDLYNDAKHKQEELEKACERYNKIITFDMNSIYYSKHLYNSIF